MLHLIDMAIYDVLQAGLPGLLPGDVTVAVSFAAPTTDQANGATIQGTLAAQGVARACAVHLLLFDLARNGELRSGVGGSPDAPTFGRGAPDLWIDATYHVSVTPSGGGAIDAQTEHLVLGAVIEALSRHRELPDAFLPPRLRDGPHPVRAVVFGGQHVGRSEFWQSLGEKPHAYFTYLVTFAVPPPPAEPAELATPVDRYNITIQPHPAGEAG